MVSTSSRCTKLLRAQTGLLLIAWYYHHYTSADMGGSFDPSHHFREPSLYPLTFSFLFCRRRHQPRRPPPANIRPGRPAPAMGPGTAGSSPQISPPPLFTVWMLK